MYNQRKEVFLIGQLENEKLMIDNKNLFNKKGFYQRKLYKTFFGIGLVFCVLISIILSIMFYQRNRSDREKAFQNVVKTQETLIHVTTEMISKKLYELHMDANFLNWIGADYTGEYYYYAKEVYDILQVANINISGLDFKMMVTKADENTFVITDAGTKSKAEFFSEKESGITLEQWNQILDRFQRDDGNQIIIVEVDGDLKSIYLIDKHISYDGEAYILVELPKDTFFPEDISSGYMMLDSDGESLYVENINDNLVSQISNIIQHSFQSFDADNLNLGGIYEDTFALSVPTLQLFLVYLWEISLWDLLTSMSIPFVIVLMLALIYLLFSSKIAENLYQPVKSTLFSFELLSDIEENKQYNEFESIRNHIEHVKTTNLGYVKLRYLRECLYQEPQQVSPLTEDEATANYAVAVIKLFPSDMEELVEGDFQRQSRGFREVIAELPKEIQDRVYYIKENTQTLAVVLQVVTREDAVEMITKIAEQVPKITNYKIGVGNVFEGSQNIRRSYTQASRVLDHEFLFSNYMVITTNEVEKVAFKVYSYPLILEKKLIQEILSGSDKFIDIYDQIVGENLEDTNLTPEVKRNFIYALINTLVRVLEETHDTGSVGMEINLRKLYSNWNKKGITLEIRQHLETIATNMQGISVDVSEETLMKMKEFIYKHYMEDIMLNDIATHCDISASYCSTLFKQLSRDNFKSFLNRYRIQKACEIMIQDPNCKVVTVGELVGFNSSNSFIRVFKQVMNLTPKNYSSYALEVKLHLLQEISL